MKSLSVAVALFSLFCLFTGIQQGDGLILLLGGTALVCALTVFLSQKISAFLKIFAALFAVETIVFGCVFMASKLGYWPKNLEDYLPPESLPVTVAIFSILVYLASFIPVIKTMTGIADRYFLTSDMGELRIWPLAPRQALERRIAIGMIVFLVLINQAQVGMDVRLSFFSRDWFNAIQNKDEPAFWSQLLFVFTPWAFVYVLSAVIEFVVTSVLIIRWRRWLTRHYAGRWMGHHNHYSMALAGAGLEGGIADNPDQRIADDVKDYVEKGPYNFTVLLISKLSSLVSYAIILWQLSANFTLPGTSILVPGFLFWVALIYSIIGTLLAHFIGRPLTALTFLQQKLEANFRFALARLREYGEQVALLNGEEAERGTLKGRFDNVVANYLNIVDRRKKLTAFTFSYGQISPIIPYIFAAPFYFAGKIQLGVMTQTARAFGSVESALNFFVTYYVTLAEFRAVLNRLSSFDTALDIAEHSLSGEKLKTIRTSSPDLVLSGVSLSLPDGRTIVRVGELTLKVGQSVLVTGPSGSGKSTLFRAIAGIWPFRNGQIRLPDGAKIMLLPQKPYIPAGTLRDAVSYPSVAGTYDDKAIIAALELAHLPAFASKLDTSDNWTQVLSGGEAQRLAIARALLAKPDWLFLDEATAALDEATEARVYEKLHAAMPGVTLVSIGHRSTLNALHQRRIAMQALSESQQDNTPVFTPAEA